MRYVNLKKRNSNKVSFVSKRLATISFACFALTAVIVVPLTGKVDKVRANNEVEVVEILNEQLVDGNVIAIND